MNNISISYLLIRDFMIDFCLLGFWNSNVWI
jgi:hypothetical protein